MKASRVSGIGEEVAGVMRELVDQFIADVLALVQKVAAQQLEAARMALEAGAGERGEERPHAGPEQRPRARRSTGQRSGARSRREARAAAPSAERVVGQQRRDNTAAAPAPASHDHAAPRSSVASPPHEQVLHPMADDSVSEIVCALGDDASRGTDAWAHYQAVLTTLGVDAVRALVEQARGVDAEGGMLAEDGRKRTVGGIFFSLARKRVGEEGWRQLRRVARQLGRKDAAPPARTERETPMADERSLASSATAGATGPQLSALRPHQVRAKPPEPEIVVRRRVP